VIVDFNQALVNKKAGELLGRSQPQLENTSVLAVMPFLKAPFSESSPKWSAPASHTQPLFQMIKDSLNGFKTVIEELTDMARIQKENGEEMDLAEVPEQVKANIPDLLAGAQVSFGIGFQVRAIHFSRRNLYSILYHLVSNALKYRHPERAPRVSLRTDLVDNQLVLTVADNGLSIGEENVPRLFILFKRFYSHVAGTGMGLYLMKRMMDNAGGKTEV
jgi:two-component system CheB/CheR fusion protein